MYSLYGNGISTITTQVILFYSSSARRECRIKKMPRKSAARSRRLSAYIIECEVFLLLLLLVWAWGSLSFCKRHLMPLDIMSKGETVQGFF